MVLIKSCSLRWLIAIVVAAALPKVSQAQLFWNTNGTLATISASNWGSSAAGPFSNAFVANNDITFSATSLVTGATVDVGNISVINSSTVTFTAAGTLGTNGTVRTLDVGTGSILDLGGQALSTAAGTGFIKNGAGILFTQGGAYAGGFTLNAGTVIIGGVNALGSGGVLTINGGTLAANATRDLTGKFAGGIVVGGDFTLGGTTTGVASGNAAAASNLTFSNAVSLGAATRTITLGGTGTYTFSGAISGAAATGLTINATAGGTVVLSGANTYTGTTTVNGLTLTVSGSLNGVTGTALAITGTGTFNVAEAANSAQGMGALSVSAGDGTIQSTFSATAATLTFGSLTRSLGAVSNFATSGGTVSTSSVVGTNRILLTDTTNTPLNTGSNNPGLFFNGSSYARYGASNQGFRAVVYGTDTNANAQLSGNAVTTLGSIDSSKDTQFLSVARATTTSGAISGVNTNTLAVTDGTLFAVGQILTGANIAANTYIAAINGNTLTLANASNGNSIGATAVAAATALTPYNSITAQTDGTVNTLNLTGLGASLTLTAGNTLFINGILRTGGSAAATSVISGGTGIASAGAGSDLVIRTALATDTLVIASPILDNAQSSLTKSGAGTLLLSGANSYTGSTYINAGTVVISNAASFGTTNILINGSSRINTSGGNITYANALAVNAPLTLQNPAVGTSTTATFTGVLSGSGAISLPNSGAGGIQGIIAFTNTANTFTGNVVLSASGSGDEFFSFSSLGDGGNFTFAKNGNRQGITYTGSSNITFNTRQIVVASTMANGNGGTDRQGMDGGGSSPVSMFANDGTGTVTFTQNMSVGAIAASTYGVLYFGGSNTGNNTFSGNISDPSGTGKLAIGKFGTGTWILSGSNTYEGNTLIGGGTLSVGTIANAATAQPLGIGAAIQLGVGNGGAAGTFSYTGSTASTDKQVVVGPPTNANGQAAAGSILNNGTGALTFTNATFNPTSTSYVIPGSGTALAGNVTVTRTLTLGGSFTGAANVIQGVIQNNATATNGFVALTKIDASTWTLSGANTYSGLTTISAGVLRITNNTSLGTTAAGVAQSGSSALEIDGSGGAVTVGAEALSINGGGISNAGALRNIAGANTYGGTVTMAAQSRINSDAGTLTLNNATAITGAFTLVVGGAGNTTISGAMTNGTGGLTKDGAGTLTLSGTNTYSGTTTINQGILNANSTAALGNGSATNRLIFTGGTLQAGGAITSASTRTVTLTSTGLIDTNGNAVSIAGIMSGAGGLTKSGANTLTLTAVNTYTGTTTVSAGTLALSGSGSFVTSPNVVVVGTLDVTALTGGTNFAGSTFALASGQTLSGTGTVNSTGVGTTIASGTTIAPGTATSAGTLSITGNTIIGGAITFKLATAGSPDGTFTGQSSPIVSHTNHDVISVTGSIDFTGSTINLSTITGNGFDGSQSYSWIVATSTTGVTGTPTIGTLGGDFASLGGTFNTAIVGNNLVLNYNAVPEPTTVLLLCAAGAFGYRGVRRKRS